jgi:hypothetical protein
LWKLRCGKGPSGRCAVDEIVIGGFKAHGGLGESPRQPMRVIIAKLAYRRGVGIVFVPRRALCREPVPVRGCRGDGCRPGAG